MIFLAVALLLIQQSMEDLRQSHDDAVRAQNDERDWWLVSTTGYGTKQHRFYIDRNQMTSMEPISRAWIDHYEVVAVKPKIEMEHDKILMLARCDAATPQLQIKTFVHYDASGEATSQAGDTSWRDVVPESSQQTLWRFICHSQPANAIVYVPDGPQSDAQRYYARAQNR